MKLLQASKRNCLCEKKRIIFSKNSQITTNYPILNLVKWQFILKNILFWKLSDFTDIINLSKSSLRLSPASAGGFT